MSNIGTVIGWKHNHQAGMSTADGVITEFPGGIPSQAEQDTWTSEYEAYVAANAYKGLRKAEYDKLNQYEMQFDDQRDGTTTWVDAINAIKAAHPKP
jgi:hypothetical protein